MNRCCPSCASHAGSVPRACGDEPWEATPGPLRELVDRFNAMTGAQQLETLEVLGRDHDRNARLGELLRDRAQAIELDQEQDRGLSF